MTRQTVLLAGVALAGPLAAQEHSSSTSIEVHGLVLLNGFRNSARVTNSDVPIVVLVPAASSARATAVGGSVRQTRLTAAIRNDDVLGGRLFGELDVDFYLYGGQQPSGGGRTHPLPRIRRASGELPGSGNPQDAFLTQPDRAERSGSPVFEGRLVARWSAGGRPVTLSIGGHYGRFVRPEDSLTSSRAVVVALSAPVGRWVELRGEGGWGQILVFPETAPELGAGFGGDNPRDSQLSSADPRIRNRTFAFSATARKAPLLLGLEVRRTTTAYLGPPTTSYANTHVNLGVGFEFQTPGADRNGGGKMARGPAPDPAAIAFEGVVPILRVRSLPASIDYYVRVLGFQVDWEHPAMASVSRGRASIMLCEEDQGNLGSWVWLGVGDVDALYQEYRGKGARIRHPPTNYQWACEMQVEDPDGNVLRLGSEPKADQAIGNWLDMHGDLWAPLPGGGWTRQALAERLCGLKGGPLSRSG